MWNGSAGPSTPSALSSTAAKPSTSVKAPSEVACMWAKSITGLIQSRREEISSTWSIDPSSLTRPITSTPNATARSFDSSFSRKVASEATTSSIVCSGERPSQKPGWMTTISAPAAAAIPAVRSSAPSAIFDFFASGWPGKAKSGACTESATSASRASSPRRSAQG